MISSSLRSLDAEVAEFVMGYEVEKLEEFPDYIGRSNLGGPAFILPDYSRDIASAWEVFEKLQDTAEQKYSLEPGWEVRSNLWITATVRDTLIISEAPTAPLAICLAALKVAGRDINKHKSLT